MFETPMKHRSHVSLPPKEHGSLPIIPNLQINLKQWRMLLAVVSHGSYAGAADHLQVSQPAISYTIAKMEEQLGMSLLHLKGRKAQLTEPGRVLLDRARHLLQQAAALEDLAETVRRSARLPARLGVERGFPVNVLLPLLRDFSAREPHVRVKLMELPKRELEECLLAHTLELIIATQIPRGFSGELLLETDHVAVAHPDHPLLRLNRELTRNDLDREVHVVPEHEWEAEDERAQQRHSCMRWKVNSVETAEAIVLEGLGYAWLAQQRVENAFRAKRLAPLPLDEGRVRKSRFYLVHAQPGALEAAGLLTALRCISSEYRQ